VGGFDLNKKAGELQRETIALYLSMIESHGWAFQIIGRAGNGICGNGVATNRVSTTQQNIVAIFVVWNWPVS
jgi:hypothetical protein